MKFGESHPFADPVSPRDPSGEMKPNPRSSINFLITPIAIFSFLQSCAHRSRRRYVRNPSSARFRNRYVARLGVATSTAITIAANSK